MKKGSKKAKITDEATLRSIASVQEIVKWAGKTKKSLERAQLSLTRAKDRHAKLLDQLPNLLKDDERDSDALRWVVNPSAIMGMVRSIDGILGSVDALSARAIDMWSEEKELAKLREQSEKQETEQLYDEVYGEKPPF